MTSCCQRLAKVHVLLDEKASKRPFDELSVECRLELQKQAASLELVTQRCARLEAGKADASVYWRLQEAQVVPMDLEDLRADMGRNLDAIRASVWDVKQHLHVLTEENDAFRDVLHQLKAERARLQPGAGSDDGSRSRSAGHPAVIARLAEMSRLTPEWAATHKNRIATSIETHDGGSEGLEGGSRGGSDSAARSLTHETAQVGGPSDEVIPHPSAVWGRGLCTCSAKAVRPDM